MYYANGPLESRPYDVRPDAMNSQVNMMVNSSHWADGNYLVSPGNFCAPPAGIRPYYQPVPGPMSSSGYGQRSMPMPHVSMGPHYGQRGGLLQTPAHNPAFMYPPNQVPDFRMPYYSMVPTTTPMPPGISNSIGWMAPRINMSQQVWNRNGPQWSSPRPVFNYPPPHRSIASAPQVANVRPTYQMVQSNTASKIGEQTFSNNIRRSEINRHAVESQNTAESRRRKALPSWIRDGLEKIEWNKLKARQKTDTDQTLGSMERMISSPTRDDDAVGSSFNRDNQMLIQFIQRELTEVLLNSTEALVKDTCESIFKRERGKAQPKLLAQTSAFSSICALGQNEEDDDDASRSSSSCWAPNETTNSENVFKQPLPLRESGTVKRRAVGDEQGDTITCVKKRKYNSRF